MCNRKKSRFGPQDSNHWNDSTRLRICALFQSQYELDPLAALSNNFMAHLASEAETMQTFNLQVTRLSIRAVLVGQGIYPHFDPYTGIYGLTGTPENKNKLTNILTSISADDSSYLARVLGSHLGVHKEKIKIQRSKKPRAESKVEFLSLLPKHLAKRIDSGLSCSAILELKGALNNE
jgi:hypothetical protein